MNLFLLIPILLMTGCSMYKSEFDCPAKKGVGCMALSNVNDALDDGTLDQHLGEDDQNQQAPARVDLVAPQTTIWFREYKDEKGKVHKDHEVQL